MIREKLVSGVLVLTIIIIACSKKTVALKEVAAPAASETLPPAPSKYTAEVVASEADLSAAGKTIYETKCVRCHSQKPTDAFTEVRWDGILKIMIPKANLSPLEAQQVTSYLRAHAKKSN